MNFVIIFDHVSQAVGIPTSVQFGRPVDSNLHFEGCIGDATYNGHLLDFAEVNPTI